MHMGGHTELYDLLGVDPSSSVDDIKKAYKRLAMQYHPDRNKEEGAEEKFKEISAAFDILKDPEKREVYDRHGMDGLEKNMGGGGGMGDILSQLFRRRHEKPTKTEDVANAIGVELQDLYTGKSQKLTIHRRVVCKLCKGTGGKEGVEVKKCETCGGHGARVMLAQIAPGFMQRVHVPCDDCDGSGDAVGSADKCEKCSGHKMIEDVEQIELVVEKGMMQGQKIVIAGKANEEPGLEAGDLIFVVQEVEHDVYKRKGDNLFIKHTLTLTEALCGFRFSLTTLDDRTLIVQSRPGEIIQPGQKKGIANEGMPRNKNAFLKGTLFVEFDVVFPETLTPEQITALAATLPAAPAFEQPAGEVDEVALTVAFHEGGDSNDQAYHEDMDGGGGGVQCHQQ